MINEQCGKTDNHELSPMCFKKCISWSAIIVGALVGIGLAFLLNLFSIAIGLSMVSNKEGMMTLAIGGFIGLLIGTIASMFMTGYAAGYLGRPYCTKRNLGVVYGFSAWCLALVLSVLLTSSMGRYVTFYSNFVSHPEIVVMANDKQAAVMDASNPSTVSTDAQTAANTLGMTSLLIFILFFVGALSSCLGGHCAMSDCREEDRCQSK